MRIVVNHLTRMQQGYFCLGGVEYETREHVRPVLARGSLPTNILLRRDNPFNMANIVDLGSVQANPQQPHVEDHIFEPSRARLEERLPPDRFWTLLNGVSEGTLRGIFGAGTKILAKIFLAATVDRLSSRRSKNVLSIFTRYPEPGKTKTRMIPALGAAGAADLQRDMTFHTMHTARRFAQRHNCRIDVRYHCGDASQMSDWLGTDLQYTAQYPGDLGCRMFQTLQDNFSHRAQRVVIAGTDCPQISESILQKAFDALIRCDVVIGPAVDGGYYLIGANIGRNVETLFTYMNWGSSTVLRDTLAIAAANDLHVKLLPTLKCPGEGAKC